MLFRSLTKADKLTYGAAKNTLLQVQKELKDTHITMTIQLFSSLKKLGIDEVHKALDALFSVSEVSEDVVNELSETIE